jgi:hypothetical protein
MILWPRRRAARGKARETAASRDRLMAEEAEDRASEAGGAWIMVEESVLPQSIPLGESLPALSPVEESLVPFGVAVGDKVHDVGAGAAAEVVGRVAEEPLLLLRFDDASGLGYATRTLAEAPRGLLQGRACVDPFCPVRRRGTSSANDWCAPLLSLSSTPLMILPIIV